MGKVMFVGIAGNAGCGKDTVADYLVTQHGFEKFALATPIKDGIQAMFNFDHEMLYGSLKEAVLENLKVTPRVMMQTLGTEWGRETIHPDIWISALQSRISDYIDATLEAEPEADIKIVVSDVRFENEADFIRQSLGGGIVVHVLRDAEAKPVGIVGHISEQIAAVQQQDVQIFNYDSLESLYRSVDGFKEQFFDRGYRAADGRYATYGAEGTGVL